MKETQIVEVLIAGEAWGERKWIMIDEDTTAGQVIERCVSTTEQPEEWAGDRFLVAPTGAVLHWTDPVWPVSVNEEGRRTFVAGRRSEMSKPRDQW